MKLFQTTLNGMQECVTTLEDMYGNPEGCLPMTSAELKAAKSLAMEAMAYLQMLSDASGYSIEDLCDQENRAEDAVDLINEEVRVTVEFVEEPGDQD